VCSGIQARITMAKSEGFSRVNGRVQHDAMRRFAESAAASQTPDQVPAFQRLVTSIAVAPGPTPEQALQTARDFVLSRADPGWADEHMHCVRSRLPLHWTERRSGDETQVARFDLALVGDGVQSWGFTDTRSGLYVKVMGPYYAGKRWLHVSASHQLSTPQWDEMIEVKDVFIGDDKRALMIAPERKYYVNVNPHMLHWWSCFESDGLPEFSRGLGVV
jgi:hypothetical protein